MDQQTNELDPEKDELYLYILKHLRRVAANLARVGALVSLSNRVYSGQSDSAIYQQDLLRAAVVFLHATLEDFLRYIGELYLPAANEDILNKVPLAGSDDSLRAEKFFLGKLSQHRGKTVDQLITESIAASLERTSFSDVADVTRLLEGAGVPLEKIRELYPQLTALMTRRHQIVHRGDLMDKPSGGQREATPIEAAAVEEWVNTVELLMSHVIATKINQDFAPQIRAKRTAYPADSKPSTLSDS